MAIELNGNWTKGFALDHHMQKSILLGYDELGILTLIAREV